jgi:HEAT repeat protein
VAVPPLLEALRTTASTRSAAQTRRSILKTLRAVGPTDPLVIRARLSALHDGDAMIRAAAAQTLDVPASEEVVSALIEALHHDEPSVAGAAAHSLGRIGLAHPAVVPELCRVMGDPRSREFADSCLSEVWQKYINGSKDDPTPYRAALLRAIPALIEAVTVPRWYDRWRCVETLGSILDWAQRSDDPEILAVLRQGVPALLLALNDEQATVRISALRALSRIGLERAAIVRGAIRLFERSAQPPEVHRAAISCVESQAGLPDPEDELRQVWAEVLTVLARALDDPDEKSKESALGTLKRLGPRARAALDPLRRIAAENRSGELQRTAAAAVQAIAIDEDLPASAPGATP